MHGVTLISVKSNTVEEVILSLSVGVIVYNRVCRSNGKVGKIYIVWQFAVLHKFYNGNL